MHERHRLADFPFPPARWPFFYGWVIVALSTLGVVASMPGQTVGVGIFNDHLIRDLGLSRVSLANTYLLGTLASGFLQPFAGRLFDRWGARTLMLLSCLLLGATLFYLSQIERIAAGALGLWTRATGSARAADDAWLAVAIALTLGFFALRFSGQGVLTMTSRNMLGKWFRRRRGLAAGISGVFVSAAFSSAPKLLEEIVVLTSWQRAWTLLAAASTGFGVFAWLIARDNPEECGLLMDGDAAPVDDAGRDGEVRDGEVRNGSASRSAAESEAALDFTLREALRTGAFWVISLGLSLQGLIITAATFHLTSLGEKVGLTRDQVLSVYLPMAWISVCATLIGGPVIDRVRLRWLFVTEMVALTFGTSGLLWFSESLGRILFIAGFGISGGLYGLTLNVVWPRFFGRTHLGKISGVNMSMMVIGSALGPSLFAWSERATGAYEAATWASLVTVGLVLLAALRLENPRRDRSSTSN